MARKKSKVGVGIIGCGNIAQAYFNGINAFEVLEVVSCADLNMAVARKKAKENGCQAQTVKALLANKAVDLVVNLTVPAAHAKVNIAALKAGKHVYCEKAFATSLEDGQAVLELAKKKGLLTGAAPDTFLGGGLQTCRKVIDDGWIGRVVGGTAFLMSRGPEAWHPNPGFFYRQGAGPMFDMGPYYITALISMLGPVKRVCAMTSQAFESRVATCKEHYGEMLPVEIPTHYSGVLEFHSGANISVTVSFDVHKHSHGPIELYGTEGSLKLPDPNTFGGPVRVYTPSSDDWRKQALSHGYTDNMRGIGPADMAYGILGKRQQRASGEQGYHVLEVMSAFMKSSEIRKHVTIKSKPVQPAALPLGLVHGRLDP